MMASGCPVARIEQVEQPHLRRQAAPVVVDVVADDLDAGERERRDVAAQHVEVAVDTRASGDEMHARLDHRLAVALRAQAGLDGVEDLVVGQRERARRPARSDSEKQLAAYVSLLGCTFAKAKLWRNSVSAWRVVPMALQSHARPADRNMTTHCVLSPNDYRRMPWKNGLGHTTANRHSSGGCRSRVVRVAGQCGRSHAGRSLFSVCRRRSHAGPADRRGDEAGGLPRADGVAHALRAAQLFRRRGAELQPGGRSGARFQSHGPARRGKRRMSSFAAKEASQSSPRTRTSATRRLERRSAWSPAIRRFRSPRTMRCW